MRSTPILADDGRPIASLAIYYTTVRTPLPDNPALIETATHLAAIALERDREKSTAAEREARLQATANTFHALVRNTPFGLWVADSDLRIFEASSTAIEAFGLPNLVGTELAEAFRVMWPEPLASEALARFRHTLQTGESYSATTTDQRRDRRDTETHDRRIERIVLPDGRHGVVCHFYELTARVRAEKALEESEARLRLATDAAEIGFWDVDPINDILFWPPIVKAMFGISPAAPVTMLEDFYACLHPDDRSHVAAAFAAACDPQQRALYDVEYRTIGKEDGVLRWVAAKGRGIFDSDGRCVRVIGTAIDISSRKAVSEALARSEADLRPAE